MRSGGVIGVVIAVIVIGGCGKKSQGVEGRVERARLALAMRDRESVRIECALDFERVDRTQGTGKELAAICEHDLPLLSAAISIEDAVWWAKGTGRPVERGDSLCGYAAAQLNKLDETEPAVKAVRFRWNLVCTPKGTVLEAPAEVQTVSEALPEIEKLAASTDPASVDVKCIVLVEEIESLLASTDKKARALGAKTDELCHLTAPLRMLEVGRDCRSAEVQAAFMILALHKKLNDPKVTAAIELWNSACPANKLEAIAK